MRILHICRQYYPSVGGVERFVSELTARLALLGNEVEIATLNRVWYAHERLPALEMVKGIPVHRVPFIGGPLFFLAPTVLGLVRRFDVIHIHNTDSFLDYLAATKSLHDRPMVVSTHGGFFHTENQAALKLLYFRWVTTRSLGAASVVIPNSLGDEQKFGSYARCSVRIDNAIDYPAFAGVRRQPRAGRLITVGRLAANKNLAALLRVFAAAHRQRPELELVIVGEGPVRVELEPLIVELNLTQAVIWRGQIDDEVLHAELAQAEVFLSAASYEGFGLALVEAMAAGVIPIVSQIRAFQALITEGENGFLIDYALIDQASQRLLWALDLPDSEKTRLSQHAQARAAEYSWDSAMPKFEKVYLQAVQSPATNL
jgi:alpha-1,3-mannosyltransferase